MKQLLNRPYPQNYLLRKPLVGAGVLFLFILGFVLIYRPLNTSESRWFGFELTMLIYSFSISLVAWLTIILFKRMPFLSGEKVWTFGRELLSIYLVLQIMGVALFLLAFAMEPPTEASRWDFPTFLDSCKYAFVIGGLPFAFSTALNARYRHRFPSTLEAMDRADDPGFPVEVKSTLKKESLRFRSGEFLFAMAEGNYAVFHLYREGQVKKILIRNSISNLSRQFQQIPAFFRCHRSFIVNLENVNSRKGNTQGYQLTLKHSDIPVPVSRNNVKSFDKLYPGN